MINTIKLIYFYLTPTVKSIALHQENSWIFHHWCANTQRKMVIRFRYDDSLFLLIVWTQNTSQLVLSWLIPWLVQERKREGFKFLKRLLIWLRSLVHFIGKRINANQFTFFALVARARTNWTWYVMILHGASTHTKHVWY